jgi:uncharacterized protein
MSMNSPPLSTRDLPAVIPVFPLPGVLLLPGAQLPLNIFEPRYLSMTDDAIKSNRIIGMIQPSDTGTGLQDPPGLRPVGCAGKITQFGETGDGRYLMTLTGIARFRIVGELETLTPYRQCKIDFEEFAGDLIAETEDNIDRKAIINTLKQFTEKRNMRVDWSDIDEARTAVLINAMAMMGPFGPSEKQTLLEAPDIRSRADTLTAIIEFELAQSAGSSSKLQ